MNEINYIEPFNRELPSDFADRLGVYYTEQVSSNHKKSNGQFFTPTPISRLLASFSQISKPRIKVLDPGCGTAILSCALVEHLVVFNAGLKQIDLIAYETDDKVIPYAKQSLDYLSAWLLNRGIIFKYTLNHSDFVLENASVLKDVRLMNLFEETKIVEDNFDVIISNPPYFKLSKEDERTLVSVELVSGQPNIYSIFMGIASRLLSKNGELIFITPRSFASGSYFRQFREFFFNSVQIEKIHLFISRKDTFNRDSVLQETVVIKAIREELNPNKKVLLSSSFGLQDLFDPRMEYFNASELIDMESKEKILYLPTSDKEKDVMSLVSGWKNTLSDFDIKISTGPVVSFRSAQFIQNKFENGTVFLAPLFWLHNVRKMVLEWPKTFKEKGQYIRVEGGSKSLLIPNKNYVLLRRFSTKDDSSRLIAAPYFRDFTNGDFIGVENKVNYIYRKGGNLERNEVVGLCGLLNSNLFNTYFQIFNGNVNVSATELREMRFPPKEEIDNLGSKIIESNDYSMNNVNQVVNELFWVEQVEKQIVN